MNGHEKAYWIADKIVALGDYAKEAAMILRKQADELAALKAEAKMPGKCSRAMLPLLEELAVLKAGQAEPVATARVGNGTFYVTCKPAQLEKLGFDLCEYQDLALYTSAPTIPEGWQEICTNELKRATLSSYPLKHEFAKEQGLADIDEVHIWMANARKAFEDMVFAISKEKTE